MGDMSSPEVIASIACPAVVSRQLAEAGKGVGELLEEGGPSAA